MKMNYAELITLTSFFESMSDSGQSIPTFIWDLFGKNYLILREHALAYNDRLYEKHKELFPNEDGVPNADKKYLEFKRSMNSEEISIELVTISKSEFLANVPSLQGVNGVYLFMKYITHEQD